MYCVSNDQFNLNAKISTSICPWVTFVLLHSYIGKLWNLYVWNFVIHPFKMFILSLYLLFLALYHFSEATEKVQGTLYAKAVILLYIVN